MPDQEPYRRARIIVVDDEAAQMEALCETLRDHADSVSGFVSPAEALGTLQKERFDLLLTDLMMPEIDGISLMRAAQAIDPDMIAIIMTGAGTIATAVEAMKAGALDFIQKPFRLSVILPVLARAMTVRNLRLENTDLHRRLLQHAARLEVLNRELEMANRDLEAYSSSVSHDLRTPLGQVMGFADLVANTTVIQQYEDVREWVGYICSSARHMNELIDDLLRLAKLGRQHVSMERVVVADLVADVREQLEPQKGERDVEFRIGPLPDCTGDEPLLRQVFINLLSNALKYSRKKAKTVIEVGCEQRNGDNVYFVRDNGSGFDMADAKNLFGVFQRLRGSEDFEGTGVGLSIVQRIIERHGGHIWADAEKDIGATFFMRLLPAQ